MRLLVLFRFAVVGVFALSGVAAAQTAPGVSVNWDALKPPPAGASVDWNALNASAPPSPAPGAAVDWSALDALPLPAAGAAVAPTLQPPPQPQVSLVPPPRPVEPPAVAVPRKPAAPAVATISPPRPPVVPQAVPPPAAAPLLPAAAPALLPGKAAMLRYAAGQSDLPADQRGTIDALAAQLSGNPKLRLQLLAYASGTGDDPVEARRLSLTRAVALRSYLIDKGVQSVRIDVRALGNRGVGDGPADRVDLVIVER